MRRWRTLCAATALIAGVAALAVGARGQGRAVSLSTVALRVHHTDAMVAFYRDRSELGSELSTPEGSVPTLATWAR